jgi:hypothetical protein
VPLFFQRIVYEKLIYNTIRFVLQECVDFTWRVSDCEELVGVTQKREWSRYANTGPDMLFLLLKALISISAPFSLLSNPH